MAALAFDLGEYDLPARNRLATETIKRYAKKHAAADAAIGLLGFLPIPGAAMMSIMAALSFQLPLYSLLAGDLARIYSAAFRDGMAQGITYSGIALDSIFTVSADIGADFIITQFGADFLQEIAGELVHELAIGLGVSLVPILGGLVSMGLDVAIAVTMTWRVGTMVALYYQNGGQWIQSRHETYEIAKKLTGAISPDNDNRVNLNNLPSANKQIFDHQVEQLACFVDALFVAAPDISDQKIKTILEQRGFPKDLIEKAIKRSRTKKR